MPQIVTLHPGPRTGVDDADVKLIAAVVTAAPLWWALGLNLFVYHGTALAVFACVTGWWLK